MLKAIRFCFASSVILILTFTGFSQSSGPAGSGELNGVWAYRTLQSKGGKEVTLTGLFLFDRGRFIQHAIHDGEPLSEQLGQAHLGSYSADGNRLELAADIGLVVAPTEAEPVESRKNSRHQIDYEISGDLLTLTFGSGTVQTFQRVGAPDAEVEWVELDGGKLALSANRFLLVSETDDQILTASGTFSGRGNELKLWAKRWFSVREKEVEYGQDALWEVSTSEGKLVLPDGSHLKFKNAS